jgi:4-hydroxy-tetrahydrodipicolinate reductase
MRILLSGLGGHMGAEVAKLCAEGYRGAELVAGVDYMNQDGAAVPCAPNFESACTDVDCIVDFSHHSCTKDLLAFAVKNRLPLVIATTGQSDEERAAIEEAAKEIPLFFAANFSVGVALLIEMAKKVAAAMPEAEIEIIEKHHDRKVDAPSGTALAIAEAIQSVRPAAAIVTGRSGFGKRTKEEIGIHAIRMGNLPGEHEVLIGTNNQTITLKHETHSRALFAEGALAAAAFLCGKPAGYYDMQSMLADD